MSALLDGRLVAHTDENGKKSWFCVECEYTQKSKKDVVKHIERRHLTLTIKCNICDYSVKSRNDLRTHMRTFHSELS